VQQQPDANPNNDGDNDRDFFHVSSTNTSSLDEFCVKSGCPIFARQFARAGRMRISAPHRAEKQGVGLLEGIA